MALVIVLIVVPIACYFAVKWCLQIVLGVATIAFTILAMVWSVVYMAWRISTWPIRRALESSGR